MKIKTFAAAALLACGLFAAPSANADITDILKNAKLGETLGNLVEGVLTKSDLEVADLAGEWKASGSAVTFQTDSFLEKAGGLATSAAVEAQLDPYFKKYGLIGSVMTVQEDGAFTLKVGKMTLSGTIEKREDGWFDFHFTAFGKVPVGSFKTYVEKSPKSLNVMFDATKLKSLLSTVAGFTGNSLATTAAKMLDSYEGMCVGFKMDKIGNVATSSDKSTSDNPLSNLLNGVTKSKTGNSTTTKGTTTTKSTTTTKGTTTTKSTSTKGTTTKSTTTQKSSTKGNTEEALKKGAEALKGLFQTGK